ncbi:metal-dependent hydrolase, partial [Thermodesulfobacteriota bacterium]
MKLTFYGHACIGLDNGSNSIVVDPWFTGNPVSGTIPDDLNPSLILATHGHNDHLGDSAEIAKKSNATFVSTPEVCHFCAKEGVTVSPTHYGGTAKFDFASVTLTPAWHSSSVVVGEDRLYAGNPCGFVIRFGGKTVYHAGDTCLFGDMSLIAERFSLDCAVLPIGDKFTMGPEDALRAVKLLKAKTIVPIHYNTWDPIKQDANAFKEAVESETSATCIVMAPGESAEIWVLCIVAT